jgi:D-alanyl-D-alanine dipeptidase
VRRDGAVAYLLLHTLGKQLDQAHPAGHPTRAAIKTPRQFLQPVVEALLQFHQKPAFLESRLVVARTHRPVQKQGLHFAQRPDHRLDRVPAQLLERRDSLIAVDD